MSPGLILISSKSTSKVAAMENTVKSFWRLARADDGDECRLYVGGTHMATVALWPAEPERGGGWFAALRPDGRLIEIHDSLKTACNHAMIVAGTIAILPQLFVDHFSAQALILANAPVSEVLNEHCNPR